MTAMTEQSADEGQLLELAGRVLAPTYPRPARLFVRGEGCQLWDAQGNRFVDMTAGVAVNALGHGSTVVREAITEAASGLIHVSNLFHSRPAIELAAALVERSFADRVFFCNSGAEAVEGAIKLARLWAGEGRRRVVYFDHSFHGRTMGALAATDRPAYQAPFTPLAGDFERATFADDAAVEAITETTAAVIVEPVQGEGGVRAAPGPWLRALRERCDSVGALLIFDEVQCGLGRTGRLWAHEHVGVTPDLMTIAKPLAGGLPMGAVLLTERVAGAITPGCHATTFGGGPLVSAVALAVVRTIGDERFLEGVRRRAQLLRRGLEALRSPLIEQVRSAGLLAGIRVKVPAGDVVRAAFDQGLLVAAAADQVVRVLPSLDVEEQQLDEAMTLLQRALVRVAEEQA